MKATTRHQKRKAASGTYLWDRRLNKHFAGIVRAAELQMIHSSSPVATELICDPEICTSATCIRHARKQNSDASVGMTSVERTRRCSATWANH
jgi:hypothetical protein